MIFYLTLLGLKNNCSKEDLITLSNILSEEPKIADLAKILKETFSLKECEEEIENVITANAVINRIDQIKKLLSYHSVFDLPQSKLNIALGNHKFIVNILSEYSLYNQNCNYISYHSLRSCIMKALKDLRVYRRKSGNDEFTNTVTRDTLDMDEDVYMELCEFMGSDFKVFHQDFIDAYESQARQTYSGRIFYSFLSGVYNNHLKGIRNKINKTQEVSVGFRSDVDKSTFPSKKDYDDKAQAILDDLDESLLNIENSKAIEYSLVTSLLFNDSTRKTPLVRLDKTSSGDGNIVLSDSSKAKHKLNLLYSSYFGTVKLLLFLKKHNISVLDLSLKAFYSPKSISVFDNLGEIVRYGSTYFDLAKMYASDDTYTGVEHYHLKIYNNKENTFIANNYTGVDDNLHSLTASLLTEPTVRGNISFEKHLTLSSLLKGHIITVYDLLTHLITDKTYEYFYIEQKDNSLATLFQQDNSIITVTNKIVTVSKLLFNLKISLKEDEFNLTEYMLFDIIGGLNNKRKLIRRLQEDYKSNKEILGVSYAQVVEDRVNSLTIEEKELLTDIIDINNFDSLATTKFLISLIKDLKLFFKENTREVLKVVELTNNIKGTTGPYAPHLSDLDKSYLKVLYNLIMSLQIVITEIVSSGIDNDNISFRERKDLLNNNILLSSIVSKLVDVTSSSELSMDNLNSLSTLTTLASEIVSVVKEQFSDFFFEISEKEFNYGLENILDISNKEFPHTEILYSKHQLYYFKTAIELVILPNIKSLVSTLASKRWNYNIQKSEVNKTPSRKLLNYLKNSTFVDTPDLEESYDISTKFKNWLNNKNLFYESKGKKLIFHPNTRLLALYDITQNNPVFESYYVTYLHSVAYFVHARYMYVSNVRTKVDGESEYQTLDWVSNIHQSVEARVL